MSELVKSLNKVINEANDVTKHDPEYATYFRELTNNLYRGHDARRIFTYLQCHYTIDSRHHVCYPVDNEDIMVYVKRGDIIITKGQGNLQLYINGKYINPTVKPADAPKLKDAITDYSIQVFTIPKETFEEEQISKDYEESYKLGFDFFDYASWGYVEDKARENFLKAYNIEDVEYQIPALANEVRIGRVDYRGYWDLEFDNWSCDLDYFRKNIKPATEEDRARNVYIHAQD